MEGRSAEFIAKYPSLGKYEREEDIVEWKDGREAAVLKYIIKRPESADLKNNPAKILEAMDHFSAQEDFLISIGSDKARLINELLKEEDPKIIVELGGYLGYSAILFGDYLKKTKSNGHVWSLEFEPEFAEIMKGLIAFAGLSDFVTVVIGAADESIRKLKADGKVNHIDWLFLDHVEDLYEQDLKNTMNLGLLQKGAVIVADNVLRPGAPAYREYVRSEPKFQSHAVEGLIMPGEFTDELEISKVL
ncbi:S-adenosyl-L-methionine-dependent methyltransferase [Acrodontium crateriforme]|uniref:catechol O-methyltransferase n=1 Tax=Acrodontium crateriforme TaxID=150365 RepID=A0AAQ3RCM3_9PEZI|nr:S-adenosyl-L-methionine-dependent methyltransferase [Acrodontium crateriforme]